LILFSFFSLFPRENKYFSRMSGTRVYVGHLSSRTRERDIEEAFSAYGRINRVDLKFGYGFVDFDDSRDAEDAVREMDGRNVDGERIIVEFARGDRRDDRSRRNPPPTEGRCFNCGKDGHWARDCPDEEGRAWLLVFSSSTVVFVIWWLRWCGGPRHPLTVETPLMISIG